MSDFDTPWRSSFAFKKAMYQQLCRPDELKEFNPKLLAVILKYGCSFDDDWYYWLTKTKRYVRRTPLWLGAKRMACDDHRVHKMPREYEPNQKLELFILSDLERKTP